MYVKRQRDFSYRRFVYRYVKNDDEKGAFYWEMSAIVQVFRTPR